MADEIKKNRTTSFSGICLFSPKYFRLFILGSKCEKKPLNLKLPQFFFLGVFPIEQHVHTTFHPSDKINAKETIQRGNGCYLYNKLQDILGRCSMVGSLFS